MVSRSQNKPELPSYGPRIIILLGDRISSGVGRQGPHTCTTLYSRGGWTFVFVAILEPQKGKENGWQNGFYSSILFYFFVYRFGLLFVYMYLPVYDRHDP